MTELNGHADHQAARVSFGPGETEEASVQLASDILTIVKRDFPLVFAVAAARAWGIDLPMPKTSRTEGK
jgi:hypothetical protein